MAPLVPQRGEVYWANLDPVIGSEIAKRRPVVIVGHDIVNARRRTVIVVPLSSSPAAHPPITVAITCLGRHVVAAVDQVRAIDKSRLVEFAEVLSPDDLQRVRQALQMIL